MDNKDLETPTNKKYISVRYRHKIQEYLINKPPVTA